MRRDHATCALVTDSLGATAGGALLHVHGCARCRYEAERRNRAALQAETIGPVANSPPPSVRSVPVSSGPLGTGASHGYDRGAAGPVGNQPHRGHFGRQSETDAPASPTDLAFSSRPGWEEAATSFAHAPPVTSARAPRAPRARQPEAPRDFAPEVQAVRAELQGETNRLKEMLEQQQALDPALLPAALSGRLSAALQYCRRLHRSHCHFRPPTIKHGHNACACREGEGQGGWECQLLR